MSNQARDYIEELEERLEHSEAEIERMRKAIRAAHEAAHEAFGPCRCAICDPPTRRRTNEGGIPGPDYPAPIGEAFDHLSRVVVRPAPNKENK